MKGFVGMNGREGQYEVAFRFDGSQRAQLLTGFSPGNVLVLLLPEQDRSVARGARANDRDFPSLAGSGDIVDPRRPRVDREGLMPPS